MVIGWISSEISLLDVNGTCSYVIRYNDLHRHVAKQKKLYAYMYYANKRNISHTWQDNLYWALSKLDCFINDNKSRKPGPQTTLENMFT